MSVIFKTLKKLKSKSATNENSNNNLVRRKKVYFYHRAFYSPSHIIMLLLVLSIIGTGTLYGYYRIRETKDGNVKYNIEQKSDVQLPTTVTTFERSVIKGKNNRDLQKNEYSDRIEYLAPKMNYKEVKGVNSDKPDNVDIPLMAAKKPSSHIKKTMSKKADIQTNAKNDNKSLSVEASAVSEMEKIFFANAKKNAKIASLVADIHWEMEHGDKIKTEKLLDELSALKGQNNSYVLKLKAVWHIHNNDYARAEDLLKTVLSKNELDQEAGINMAIIEIEKQHLQKAYQRLKKLRTIYPENIRIAEILQNLQTGLN